MTPEKLDPETKRLRKLTALRRHDRQVASRQCRHFAR
jgi:hypothetical protein